MRVLQTDSLVVLVLHSRAKPQQRHLMSLEAACRCDQKVLKSGSPGNGTSGAPVFESSGHSLGIIMKGGNERNQRPSSNVITKVARWGAL